VFSDNGWNNGPKNYVYKNGPWDDATKVPLIIRAPGAQVEGHVSTEIVTLVDIYPTLMELTGFSPTDEDTRKNDKGKRLSGKSLATALLGGSSSDYDFAVSQVYPTQNIRLLEWPHCNDDPTCSHFTVRSRTHRYILYNDGSEELYAYGADGEEFESETQNLADSPEYADVKAELKLHLESMPSLASYKDNLGSWSTGTKQPYKSCCENYCYTNSKDWSAGKCGWNACGMCPECDTPWETCWDEATQIYVVKGSLTDVGGAPTPEPTNFVGDNCNAWCYTSSNTEEELCTWSSCKACSFC